MTITYGEAEKFYSDLLDSKTPRSAKYLVYQTYAEAKERNELISKVLAAWGGNTRPVTLRQEVYTITNNLFIIEEDFSKNQDYSIVVKNEDEDFIVYPFYYSSFNQTLLAAYIILTYPKLAGSRRTEAMDFINKYLYYFNKEDTNND